jgi:small subunit ribosomal protein S2
VDYVIPANDDAIRAVQLLTDIMAKAVIDGKQAFLEGADITTEDVAPSEPVEESEENAE